tara:strand:+ start:2973 stop:3146 length:174 start_codon:yes stop_codon:yes gene_type:complete
MNLLPYVFAERSPFDLSKLDFSSGFAINSPDLAGIALLIVVLAGAFALRLGTNLRDF